MTQARRQRLKEARDWYPEQHFAADSHIVKAYKKRFSVDNNCAMRELVMLGVLPPEKSKAYQGLLAAKDKRRAEKREAKKNPIVDVSPFQDENFFFIAGYTSGGAPYGVTWEQAREDGLLEE